MGHVISARAVPELPVDGSTDTFPVRSIYCVGRNYAEHAREMGSDPDREPPFFFMKPTSAIIGEDAEFPYPPGSDNVQFEMELVACIGTGGRDIKQADALDHVYGYAVGLDMTRRDLQIASREIKRPWEVGKAFAASAPCGRVYPASKIGHPSSGDIWLDVNGERKQSADLGDLIWNIPETIEHLSALFTLEPGDLIYTGTPAGVGPIKAGDVMHGHVDGVGDITIKVV